MDDRLEQLADTLCLTGATRVERFGKQAADLTSLAPKWKDRQHIMVALRQHLQEAQQALDTEDEQKELTDLALITDAYRRSQVGRQLLRQRMAKFRQFADSPSLADQPASHVKQATQLQKTAASPMQESSYLQDFAAGVDPFGVVTFNSARRNQLMNSQRHWKHRAVATLGGTVGGAAVVTPGVLGGIKGLSRAIVAPGGIKGRLLAAGAGFGQGAAEPFRRLFHGLRASKGLSSVARGGKLTVPQVKSMSFIASSSGLPIRTLPRALSDTASLLPPAKAQEMSKAVRRNVLEGLGTLGATGALSSGAAFLQYGAGVRSGQSLQDAYTAGLNRSSLSRLAPGFGIDAGGGGVKIGEDTQYRLSPEYARRLQDLSPRGERSAMHDWLDLHTEKVAFNPFIAAGKLGLRGAGIAYRGMKSGLGLTRAQNARRVMSAMRSAPNRRHYDRIVRSAKATGVKGPSLLNPLGWMTPLSTAESRFTQAGRARWLAQQAAGNTRAWKRVAGGMTPSHARQAQQAITQSKVMAPRSVMGAPAQRMAIQDSLRRTDPNMIGYMAAYPSVFNPAKRAIGFGGGDAGGFDQEMPYAGYDEGMS